MRMEPNSMAQMGPLYRLVAIQEIRLDRADFIDRRVRLALR